MQPSKHIQDLQKRIRFDPEVPIGRIYPNPLNPRKVFRDKDINDLCDSIIEMGGIIVPLVIFETTPGQYVLLDGERRLRAAKKLGMKTVPANLIAGQLSAADNLSTMFNIHMAREPWDPASRALALGKLKELYKGISLEELSDITGMSKMALRDAERVLSFPSDIIERCLQEGKPEYLRPSNLIEMAKAFEIIDFYLPDFFKGNDRQEACRSLVKKIDTKIIPRNTDFRLIKTMFNYIPRDQMEDLVSKIIKEPDMGISDAFRLVEDKIYSKRFDLFKSSCMKFVEIVKDFRLENVDKRTADEAIKLLKETQEAIVKKIQSLER
jgi:ParB/RepB/Spo0J family partition protein